MRPWPEKVVVGFDLQRETAVSRVEEIPELSPPAAKPGGSSSYAGVQW